MTSKRTQLPLRKWNLGRNTPLQEGCESKEGFSDKTSPSGLPVSQPAGTTARELRAGKAPEPLGVSAARRRRAGSRARAAAGRTASVLCGQGRNGARVGACNNRVLTAGCRADRRSSPNGKHYLWPSSPSQRQGSAYCRQRNSRWYQRACQRSTIIRSHFN